MSDELRCVSQGCNRKVEKYEKYDVNGFRFHTEFHQNSRPNAKTINTGVFTKGAGEFDYYGRLQNVYEVMYNNTNIELKLVVFRCHWFDPTERGLRKTPSIGLVEVKPSTTYSRSDVFVVAHQAKQVYYLPYPCKKEGLNGWEVVFHVSPHGKLPMPSDDDYNNIDPKTYEGIFYQEQESFDDFDIQQDLWGLGDLENESQTGGEAVMDLKEVDMLKKFHEDIANADEPPPCDEHPPYYSRDSDPDSDDENSRQSYESDGEGLLCLCLVFNFPHVLSLVLIFLAFFYYA